MNILTHPVHTGYQFDLAKTGHEFYSIPLSDKELFWDEHSRPKPKNFHILKSLSEAPVTFDLVLVHFDLGFEALKHLDLPIVFKEHCVRSPFQVPQEWIDRVNYFSFASQTAADAWRMSDLALYKKVIIGMGVDTELYKGYTGAGRNVLAVGNSIPRRGRTKGAKELRELALSIDIDVVGGDNPGINGAINACHNHAELINHYQTHKIFLNPSSLLSLSTLEAMATGMPVVSFKMVNSDIIENGLNGILVESVLEAKGAIQKLLNDDELRHRIGAMARRTIKTRFAPQNFKRRWNSLFRLAVGDREHQQAIWDNWRIRLPMNMATKNQRERLAAQNLMRCTYDYWWIGYDHRQMSFLPDGKIGLGATTDEVFWEVREANDELALEIYSNENVTCELKQQPNGNWSGRPLKKEAHVVLGPIDFHIRSAARHEEEKSRIVSLDKKAMRILALIAFRNEEGCLEGFFNHLTDYVDGFIAFDDCSADSSKSIARAQPKLLTLLERHVLSPDHYYESHNREALLRMAYHLGADWVLCCDADERYETRFLQDLKDIVKEETLPVKALHLRPLWGNLEQYRVGNAHKCVLFPSTEFRSYHARHRLHGQWQPPILNRPSLRTILDYNLYHLGSLTQELRFARYQKFEAIDPLHKAHPEGYQGLIDERNVITVPIPPEREFKL